MARLTFSHMALTCKDPLATERFYTRYFGFKRARVVDLGKSQVVFLLQHPQSGPENVEENDLPAPSTLQAQKMSPEKPSIASGFAPASFYIELFQSSETSPISAIPFGSGPEYPGWRHLAFLVDDVDAKLAEMGEAAKITAGPINFDSVIPGWRSVWLADPEGNCIEISQGFVDQENPPSLPAERETGEKYVGANKV